MRVDVDGDKKYGREEESEMHVDCGEGLFLFVGKER